jgi:hypothetical protein
VRGALEAQGAQGKTARVLAPLNDLFDLHASESLVASRLAPAPLGASTEAPANQVHSARKQLEAKLFFALGPASVPPFRSALARAVHRALAALFPTDPATDAKAPEAPCVVGADGRWFQLGSSPLVSLERRRPLVRMVAALAQAHASGAPLSSFDLQEAGWPGERMLPSAGVHRVRVAISTLRKLGLGRFLETMETGYGFSSQVTFRASKSRPS